ncbi:MAG: translation initiation factor IF-2, partial [Candidatus Peribacteraceae bacterium]|nr:translation initiation factor IF-2 [Candidatus Peribacteraceae bacterium]
ENSCFLANLRNQDTRSQDEIEEKLYKIVGQLSQKGFKSERYDRVEDFAKEVCIVPVSGTTGEGVPDLLMTLTGLAQRYLEKRLEVSDKIGKGTILEVREFTGLGTTIDVILYDGTINKGDTLIIGGNEMVITKVKALMKPEPLKEMRIERKFKAIDRVSAATGVKISAPGIENVIAGSPVRFVKNEADIEAAKVEIEKEIEEVEIETESEGIIIKSDTLGSLEGMIKALKDLNIPIRKAKVGRVLKADVMESSGMKNPVIFAFHIGILPDALETAKRENVKIFKSDIIYKILEDFDEWEKGKKKVKEASLLDSVTHPGRMSVLRGYVFRQSKPAVFGVEITDGIVKVGYKVKRGDAVVGEIKELQAEGKNVNSAKAGDKVAVSMDGVTIGRQINEGDTLENYVRDKDLSILQQLKPKLTESERRLLEKMEKQ